MLKLTKRNALKETALHSAIGGRNYIYNGYMLKKNIKNKMNLIMSDITLKVKHGEMLMNM